MENIILTPAQEREFGTPLLQAFAKSYIAFQRSSPYTTRRKLFRYFEPLSVDELPERDALFGADREEAYKALMKDFEACLMVGAFDNLFEGKNHYWRSETLPKLVILKKWLEKPQEGGSNA